MVVDLPLVDSQKLYHESTLYRNGSKGREGNLRHWRIDDGVTSDAVTWFGVWEVFGKLREGHNRILSDVFIPPVFLVFGWQLIFE